MKQRWPYRRQPDYDLTPQFPQPPTSWPTTPEVPAVPVPELASHYIKPQRPKLVGFGIALLVVALSALGIWGFNAYRNSPSVIFGQALATGLHTQQVKQIIHDGTNELTITYDVREPKNPRTNTLITKSLGVSTYVKGYGSMRNTYLSYASNPTAQSVTPTKLLDRWIGVRTNQTLPQNIAANAVASQIDPRFQLLGPWIFGNFSKDGRSELLDFAKSSQLYRFDAKKVSQTQLGGQPVLIYNVSLNAAVLEEYNRRAAELFGIPQTDVPRATEAFKNIKQVKLYISKKSKQLVRLESINTGVKYTIDYRDHNAAKLTAEPRADLTYKVYLEQL